MKTKIPVKSLFFCYPKMKKMDNKKLGNFENFKKKKKFFVVTIKKNIEKTEFRPLWFKIEKS